MSVAPPQTQDELCNQVLTQFNVINDPRTPQAERSAAEHRLKALVPLCAQNAATALQREDVANNQQLHWFFISSVEQELRRYWVSSIDVKLGIIKDVQRLLEVCSPRTPFVAKIHSLNVTILTWAASEHISPAVDLLRQMVQWEQFIGRDAVQQTTQLSQCTVLVDNLSSGVLRTDSSLTGTAPSPSLDVLRTLYLHELQPGLGHLVVGVLHKTDNADEVLCKGLQLLSRVANVTRSADMIVVPAPDLLSACLPLLSPAREGLHDAAIEAIIAVCAMPMIREHRRALQEQLLWVLLANVPDIGSATQPRLSLLSCAQLVHALVDEAKLTIWDMTPTTAANFQRYLHLAAVQATQQRSAADQLRCLEPWMVWLSRLSDLEESAYDTPDPDAKMEEFRALTAPYTQGAISLLDLLLPCLSRCKQASNMAVSSHMLSVEPNSGGVLEDVASELTLGSNASVHAAVEQAADLQEPLETLSNPTCTALRSWDASEHAVYCGYIENVLAQASRFGGSAGALRVWHAAMQAMQDTGAGLESGDAQRAMALALDAYVLCRVASRCAHCMEGTEEMQPLMLLQSALGYVEGALRIHDKLQWGHPCAQAFAVSVSGALHAICALTSMWLSSEFCSAHAHDDRFGQHVVDQLNIIAAVVHACSGQVSVPNPAEGSVMLATQAAEALFALTHIVLSSCALSKPLLQALLSSRGAAILQECAVHYAVHSGDVQQQLPVRLLHDLWAAFADMQVVIPTRVKDNEEADTTRAVESLSNTLAPAYNAWEWVHRAITSNSTQASQATALTPRLALFVATLCDTVRHGMRAAKRCMFSALRPMLQATIELMAHDQGCGSTDLLQPLSSTLAAAVQSLLADMPPDMVAAIMQACARVRSAGADLKAKEQVVRLIWALSDDASAHIVPLLQQAAAFLAGCLRECPEVGSSDQAHFACLALRALLHLLACRYSKLVKADASCEELPVEVAQQMTALLQAAAVGQLPNVPPDTIRALLEEYFDMQRMTGLYKRSSVATWRPRLQKALLDLMINPLWASITDSVMDLFWGLSATDWDAFVGSFLPSYCQAGNELVLQVASSLIRPFRDPSASLNNFDHFATCVARFINDVRFFSKVQG